MPARKPTALKVLEGERGHRTKKELARRDNEPKPRPIRPEMPDYLDAEGRRRWNELVDELESVGVLTIVDRDVLGGYCDAYATFVGASKKLEADGWVKVAPTSGYEMPSPWVAIRNRALDDMRRFGAELGIGAASRSRIEVKKKEADGNPLAEILAEAQKEAAHRRGKG